MKTIVISSPASDAGITMVAMGLSEAAAAQGQRTLLVDLDNTGGELLTINGRELAGICPTVQDWHEREWCEYARSQQGVYLLPQAASAVAHYPSGIHEIYRAAPEFFDLLVVDLGLKPGNASWRQMVEEADTAILVTDCGSKAMFRVSEFLKACHARPPGKWLLVINHREGRQSFYTPRQMSRTLGCHEDVCATVQIPHIDKINKLRPPCFAYNDPVAGLLLNHIGTASQAPGCSEAAPVVALPHECRHISKPDSTETMNEYQESASRACQENNRLVPVSKKIGLISLPFKGIEWLARKRGVIVAGRFIRERFSDPLEMLDKYDSETLDAIVIPAFMGFDAVKKCRRDQRTQAIILVVINGGQEHIALGADRVASRLSSEMIRSIGRFKSINDTGHVIAMGRRI